jgi:PPOX class probable F420-dependent enzyme
MPTKTVQLTDEVRDLLQQPVIAYLATTFESGQPQVTPVWIDLEEDRPVFNTAVGRVKERHLRRDPRLSLAFHAPDDAYRYVEIRGTAEFSEQGADEMIDRLAQKYLGTERYPWHKATERRINVFVNPTRISGMDS